MNAPVRQIRDTVEHTDIAGRYARLDENFFAEPASELALNEVFDRDFRAEANRAIRLVDVAVRTSEARADYQKSIVGTALFTLSKSDPQSQTIDLIAPPVPNNIDPRQVYFVSTIEWDGYVVALRGNNFEAVVYPAGDNRLVEDLVTIPLDLVDENLRDKILVGAIFRMATGRQRINRQIMHGTKIYFRPLANQTSMVPPDMDALAEFFAD